GRATRRPSRGSGPRRRAYQRAAAVPRGRWRGPGVRWKRLAGAADDAAQPALAAGRGEQLADGGVVALRDARLVLQAAARDEAVEAELVELADRRDERREARAAV